MRIAEVRVLSLEGLRLLKPPRVSFNDLVQGYELRGLEVVLS